MKKLEELRVVDLRAELDKRGLDKTGVKAILIERLKKSIQTEGGDPEAYECVESKNLNRSTQEDEHDSMEYENSNGDAVNDLKESVNVEEDTNGENCQADDTASQKGSSSPVKKEGGRQKERSRKAEPDDAADEGNISNDIEDKEVFMPEEEEEELRGLEEELLMEEVENELHEDLKEASDGLTREDYAQHMEDDSINLMLEDDDKMLDYEENDRIDLEEVSSSDFKDKEDTNGTKETSSESSTKGEKKQDKSEKEHARSSKSHDGKEREDKEEKSQAESINNRNLWVSGLVSNTRAQDLKSLFSKHGKVLSAKIVTNAKTPGAKCYGFVTMAFSDDASKCIGNLNRTELHGRMIQVEKAKGEPRGPKSVPVSKSSSQSSKDVGSSHSTSNGKVGDKSKDTGRKESQKRGESRGRSGKDSSEKDKSRSSTRERTRHSRGKSSSQSRTQRRSGDGDKGRRSKDRDLRSRLSAKERVVDRRHEIKRDGFSSPPKASGRRDMLSLHRIMEERERQRLRTRERLMREEERMRRDEAMHLRTLERRQKEEAERLHREREKLRMEREKIERQKQELLRMEREQQRMEREKLERERDELRKQQIKYEEVRRGVKRPVPPSDRDRRDFYEDRKRVAERAGADRGPPPSRVPDRSAVDRNMHRGGPDRGSLLRGPDRGGSVRSADRSAERGGPRGPPERRFDDDERESRYDHRHADRVPAIRGSSQYDDRRERDERRPMDRSVPRGEGRDHRVGPLPPPSTMRDRPTRESHYNGNSLSSVPMDSWRTGGTSHSSKNGPSYGSSGSGMMSSSSSRGVENPNNWRPSSSISTNERWGGGNSSGVGSGRSSSSIMDILRGSDSYHMSGSQVPMNPVPLMSGMSQGDRFASLGGFRK